MAGTSGRREVLGMKIGLLEAGSFWIDLPRDLHGVELLVSDAHDSIKAAVTRMLSTIWQRCRVHFMRNVLARAGNDGRRVVSACVATAQDTAEAAKA